LDLQDQTEKLEPLELPDLLVSRVRVWWAEREPPGCRVLLDPQDPMDSLECLDRAVSPELRDSQVLKDLRELPGQRVSTVPVERVEYWVPPVQLE